MIGGNLTAKTRKALIAFKGTHKDAAAKYGVAITTARRIRVEAGNHGKVLPTFSDDDVATIEAMLAAGRSHADIARALGRPRSSVSAKISAARIGLPQPQAKVAPWVARALAAWEKTGVK